jgi:CBS domain-containing protein
MVPLEIARGVAPDTSLLEVLEKMDDLGASRLPVLEDGILRGIVSREDILRRTALYVQFGGRSQ